jgi:hypothetical protein
MSFTRLVDTVLNAPIKRPNGLRRVGTMSEPALRQRPQACDETGIAHRRFAYQDRVGACDP